MTNELRGTIVRRESRSPKIRFDWEYFPGNVSKFQISGPWRDHVNTAKADGRRLEKIALRLVSQLADLDTKDLDEVIRQDALTWRRK